MISECPLSAFGAIRTLAGLAHMLPDPNATKRLRTWPVSVPGVVAQLEALVGEPPADDGRGASQLSVSLRFALQSANGRPGAPALTSQANDAGSAPRPGEDQAWKRNSALFPRTGIAG